MANVQKYAASASGHLAAHYERRKGNDGEYIKFGNQNIDTSRTHLNYNLAPEREGGQIAFIQRRTSEARTLKRDDVKVMCSWVVTLPEYKYHNPLIHLHVDKEEIEKLFFERTYKFLCDRYGEQNVISAYVHMDEKTPHLHFSFVPVTEDKKRGGEKVSAKEVLTKKDLQTFHDDLERHLDSFRDWKFEVQNEATKDGNKTVAELKKQAAHQEVLKAQQEAAEARQKALKEQERIIPLQKRKETLESEIDALEAEKTRLLSSEEVKAVRGEKGLIYTRVSTKEWEAVKRTAAHVDTIMPRTERAEERVRELEAENRSLRVENSKLQELVNKLQHALEILKAAIKDIVPQLYDKILNRTLTLDKPSKEPEKKDKAADAYAEKEKKQMTMKDVKSTIARAKEEMAHPEGKTRQHKRNEKDISD